MGPTYILPVMKALEDAAIEHGLQEDVARTLMSHMVEGTAAMTRETMKSPAVLQQATVNDTAATSFEWLEEKMEKGTCCNTCSIYNAGEA